MTTDRSHVARNDTERARLEALVARCSDADLERLLPGGWTVAATLAHLAFWDERIQLLFDRWQREGTPPPPEDEASVDWINDSAKPMFLALPPRRAATLAVEIARATDRVVERLSDEMLARNSALAQPLNVVRATHRREHLDEIEAVLGRRA
jgi:hypothetical protein